MFLTSDTVFVTNGYHIPLPIICLDAIIVYKVLFCEFPELPEVCSTLIFLVGDRPVDFFKQGFCLWVGQNVG